MNKYQLANISIAGKKLARLFTESWEDDKAPNPTTPEGRKAHFKNLQPDSAISRFGNSSKFTAFIYSVMSDTLYCQPGNQYHYSGLHGESELEKAKSEKETSRFLFGRFGESSPFGGFVTIWNTAKNPADQYYGFPIADENGLRKMLMSMVKGSVKVVGQCPAKLPITPDYVIVNHEDGMGSGPMLVSDMIRGMLTFAAMTPDKCSNVAKINVGGKELSLSTIIGNLHMVKGKELEMMKRAICLDKDKIKAELEKHKCTSQLDILHDIVSKVSCDFGDWKYGYRQELKKMLHPDNIDSFRSQKEIDAAWDRLHPKEGKLNFSNWLKLRETK